MRWLDDIPSSEVRLLLVMLAIVTALVVVGSILDFSTLAVTDRRDVGAQ